MIRKTLLLALSTLALATPSTLAQDAPAVEKAKSVPAIQLVPAPQAAPGAQNAPPAITLHLGDAAPAFQVDAWVKGDSFSAFEQGNVYVLEFWATWCGPCIAAMPHLTALQAKYPDVRFVGVASSEHGKDAAEDIAKVTAFVEKKGEGMGYRVIFAGDPAKMSAPYMVAAGQNGIPCTYIIDQKSRVAWIGHPSQMDAPLAKIIDGTWDTAAAAKVMEAEQSARAVIMKIGAAHRLAKKSGDWAPVLILLDEAMAADPTSASTRIQAMKILAGPAKNPEKAWKLGREALVLAKNEPMLLNQIAWSICASDNFETRDMQLALAAAELMVAASKNDPNPAYLDTCARCLWMTGKKDAAIKMQIEAAKLAEGTPMAEGITETLASYEADEDPASERVP